MCPGYSAFVNIRSLYMFSSGNLVAEFDFGKMTMYSRLYPGNPVTGVDFGKITILIVIDCTRGTP